MTRILVIRHGALGDFVLSFGPFAAIRHHHPAAEISLLTTAPFAGLAARAPWFDRVIVDAKPRWRDLAGQWRLTRALWGYDFVYDLQTSGRSSRYFLRAGAPAWSGIARFSSHRHHAADRTRLHTLERQRDQLRIAGIATFPTPDLRWIELDLGAWALPAAYSMLVPGAAPTRPEKRWPAARFGALAQALDQRGLPPLIVGTRHDRPLAAAIRAVCPTARDLTGATSIEALASIAKAARLVIGNDTGPMHLAAAVGAPCMVLFGPSSDPALTAPRGRVRVVAARDLDALEVGAVVQAAKEDFFL